MQDTYTDGLMLAKVNSINEQTNKVNVTLLDVDDLGSVVPVKDLELNLPVFDDSILDILKSSSHVIIFIEGFSDENNSTIISAVNLTDDDLNDEKEHMIKFPGDKSKKSV
ncbi:MAG: hypothetical protein H0X50_07630 [Nitrosopumilus sp.]|nr:hypothetical protein [Nitrosopumilus sp.]